MNETIFSLLLGAFQMQCFFANSIKRKGLCTLNCPKCGKEMEAGYLQTDMQVGITWVKKPIAFGLGWWGKDAVTVSDQIAFNLAGVPAHICKSCKLFLGDYSDNNI